MMLDSPRGCGPRPLPVAEPALIDLPPRPRSPGAWGSAAGDFMADRRVLGAASPAAPGTAEPALRRQEFVAACEALLADSPGFASVAELHELFDALDHGGTGQVSLREFSRLLRTHRQEEVKPRFWDDDATADAALRTPLSGVREWMLHNNWLFQDIVVRVLGSPLARLSQRELEERLRSHIRAPWMTPQGAADIFRLLKVAGEPGSEPEVVRVEDFLEALLTSAPFADEVAKQALRVLFREARHRHVDIVQACRNADAQRTGLLSFQQFASVVRRDCPDMFADADIALIYRRFASAAPIGGKCLRIDLFAAALEAERCDGLEHLLRRAWHRLCEQAAAFQRFALQADKTRRGTLSEVQLVQVLSSLGLGLSQEGLKEVSDFAQLLAKATQQNVDAFNYADVVKNDKWAGPSLDEAIKSVQRRLPDTVVATASAPKAYLLAIMYYKTAKGAQKLNLTATVTCERLDRAGKGIISAEDLRLAVVDVVGTSETLADLGLNPGSQMTFAEVAKHLDFDMTPLRKHGLQRLFGEERVLTEQQIVENTAAFGLDPVTFRTWLQLIYPMGVPISGVEQCRLETFLATHTDAAPVHGDVGGVGNMVAARKMLLAATPALRIAILERFDVPAAAANGPLDLWLSSDQIKAMVPSFTPLASVADAVASTSKLYRASGDDGSAGQILRAETLLACAEQYQEHVLEVFLLSVTGLDTVKAPAVAAAGTLELALRYHCYGSEYAAETAGLAAGGPAESAKLDFSAQHTFGLSSGDSLSALFVAPTEALTVQAWAGVCGGARQLVAMAALPAQEMRDFLEAARKAKSAPEALLGSRTAWTLEFKTPDIRFKDAVGDPAGSMLRATITINVMYSRRSPSDQGNPPLPWTSTFAGRSLLCRRAAELGADAVDWDMHTPAKPPPAPPAPEPGEVNVVMTLDELAVRPSTLCELIALCLSSGTGPTSLPMDPKSWAHKFSLFLRLCMLPKMQPLNGCGWEQSAVMPLPEACFATDAQPVPIKFGFSCRAPKLHATEAVAALKDGSAILELWLRVDTGSSTKFSADVRLAEATYGLADLLRQASPEEPTKLRLRTLRDVSLAGVVTFSRDADIVGDLALSSELHMPGGPAMLSWFLDTPKPAPKPAAPVHDKANYSARICEVLLSRLAPAAAASSASTAPFFFVEIGEDKEWSAGAAWHSRSAPVQGKEDAWGLVRVVFAEDAQISLPKRPLIGESPASDAEIRQGLHHGLRLNVWRLAGAGEHVAEATLQLPHGCESGIPSPFFAGRLWVPLVHPTTGTVGRALLAIEAEKDGADPATRVFRSLPLVPTGVWLPLYSPWIVSKGPWLLESTIRAAVGGEEVCSHFTAAESRASAVKGGAVLAEDFEAILLQKDLGDDLASLRSSAAAFLADEKRLVPYKQMLHWMAIRRLASAVLPTAGRLLRRLRELDRARGGDSGTLPLVALQEAMRVELRLVDVAVPAALWELLERRPQWTLGNMGLYGQQHFDYLAFFWDLAHSGVTVARPGAALGLPPGPGPGPGPSPSPPARPSSSGLAVELSIFRAWRLPSVGGREPSTYAAFSWAHRGGGSTNELNADGLLGRTELEFNTPDPIWNYSVLISLPRVLGQGGREIVSEDIFSELTLLVHIMHVADSTGAEEPLGTAEIQLAPLHSRRGLGSIDGCFHIETGGSAGSDAHFRGPVIKASVQPWFAADLAGREVLPSPLPAQAAPPLHLAPPSDEPWGELPRCWLFGEAAGCRGLQDAAPQAYEPMRFTPNPAASVYAPWLAPASPHQALGQFPSYTSVTFGTSGPRAVAERMPSIFKAEGERDAQMRARLWPGPVEPFAEAAGVRDDVSETALRFASRLSDTELRLCAMEGTNEEQLARLRVMHRENLTTLDLLQQGMLPGIPEPAFLAGGRGRVPPRERLESDRSRRSLSPREVAAVAPAAAEPPRQSCESVAPAAAAALPRLGGALLPEPGWHAQAFEARSSFDRAAEALRGATREEIARRLFDAPAWPPEEAPGDARGSRSTLFADVGHELRDSLGSEMHVAASDDAALQAVSRVVAAKASCVRSSRAEDEPARSPRTAMLFSWLSMRV